MGLPGPDAGRGGRHLLLSPGYDREIPDDYHVARATPCRLNAGVRSLPVGGDVEAANELIRTVGSSRSTPARPGAAVVRRLTERD